MNLSTAIFLINKDTRGILVIYDPTNVHETDSAKQKYLFKTLDQGIKKDDLVVVPTGTRHGFTIAKVVETDVDPDYNSSIDYKWIAGVFDPAPYKGTIALEADMNAQVKRAEMRAMRKELAAKVFENQQAEMAALPMYKNGDLIEGPAWTGAPTPPPSNKK